MKIALSSFCGISRFVPGMYRISSPGRFAASLSLLTLVILGLGPARTEASFAQRR
jgi:hypothetical protein